MKIPLWSENNSEFKDMLTITIPVEWSNLAVEDKKRMWKYLERELFDPQPDENKSTFHSKSCSYRFYGDSWDNDHMLNVVGTSVHLLNLKYKKQSYARGTLERGTYNDACSDFYNIFINGERDVVFELLSIFSNIMVVEDGEQIHRKARERIASFEKRKEERSWKRFDGFSSSINEVFNDFGINYQLTRAGIIPSDEPAVIEEIYAPALRKLSNKKWADINRDLRDSFQAMNKDKDGSGALTHALSALQGFMQILVCGKTGKGNTGQLITTAIKNKVIPDDDFSKNMINDMYSFWAKERQDKGDPHPKKQYATKAQAKLVISLVMVFMDHVL